MDERPNPFTARDIPAFPSGLSGEIWREIVGTERDQDSCGRFAYVAEKLIAEDRFRERTLEVMREIRGRCFEKDGGHYYRFDRRDEIDPGRLASVRQHLDGVGEFTVASMRELVPRPSWMSRGQWTRAFRRFVDVMIGDDDREPLVRRAALVSMFGSVPVPHLPQFELPARCLFPGGLVHKTLMGDLAHLLAVVAAIAASNYQDAFYRAADYAIEAAKTPPLVVASVDGGFHLIHVCAD